MPADPPALDPEVAAELRAKVRELPALTDPQLDALADVLVQIDLDRAAR